MDIDTLKGLQACPLFKGLGENDIISLMHSVRYRLLHYKKGEIFAFAGDECMHADIVISGVMSARIEGKSNRIVRMHTHAVGSMLAPAFLFANDNLYPVTIEATTNVTILRMQPLDVEAMLHQSDLVGMNFVRLLSNNIAYLTHKVSFITLSIREKIEQFIKTEAHKQQSTRIRITMSRQEMADTFGIQKYSLQRCLSEMQKEGVIRLDGKYIEIMGRSRTEKDSVRN